MRINRFLIAFALLFGQVLSATSQKINNKNYYEFKQSSGTTNWLRSSDAVIVIIDELLKNNIAYHTISIGDLIKINDTTRLVVTVSFKKNDKEYGFLYETGHSVPLDPKERDFLINPKNLFYVQVETDTANKLSFMTIDPIPHNIFLLKETCYWFQYGFGEKNYPVSKEIAQQILRQDVWDYLDRIK